MGVKKEASILFISQTFLNSVVSSVIFDCGFHDASSVLMRVFDINVRDNCFLLFLYLLSYRQSYLHTEIQAFMHTAMQTRAHKFIHTAIHS